MKNENKIATPAPAGGYSPAQALMYPLRKLYRYGSAKPRAIAVTADQFDSLCDSVLPLDGITSGDWVLKQTHDEAGVTLYQVWTRDGYLRFEGRNLQAIRLAFGAPALLAALRGLLTLETRYTGVGLKEFDAARAALALAGGDK